MKFHIETREVLAAAYLGPNKGRGRMLSHSAVVDEMGATASVLCRRVEVGSLADRNASDPNVAPTCESCRRALKKRSASATKTGAVDPSAADPGKLTTRGKESS